MKKKHKLLTALLVALILVIYLLPIYVLLMVSFKPMTDYTPRLQPPKTIYWQNFVRAITVSGMGRAIINTLIITVGTVFVEVVCGGLAAYPMARQKGKLSKGVRMFILGVMMVPGLSLVVGIYSTLVSIHAINTFWGIILITATFGLPWTIYLYSNFISSIPKELDEAAAIDGAGVFTTFFRVIMPQLKPVTVTVIVMQGVGAWNEYGYSLYILTKPNMYNVTLTVKQFFGNNTSDLNGAAAAAVIAIVPVIIVYLVLQKYFVAGAIDSSVKG